MIRILTFALASILAITTLTAQVKTVHFKKLQECLPTKEIKGYDRKKPSGQTQSMMGMSTSEASVEYSTTMPKDENAPPPPEMITIKTKISDMVGMPYAMAPFMWMQEMDNETENSYEKTVTVAGKYKGMEEGGTTDENKFTKVNFGVANRFVIEIEITGRNDKELLTQVVGLVDLVKLEKLSTETK